MTTLDALHSRSILAGYNPELLANARVSVIGLGALGQNVVQNLALLGIGHLLLVDFDNFEAHNATRSPFYPSQREIAELGKGKAAVVAHQAALVSTAMDPEVYYSDHMVQVLGDGAIEWADVVVAAVDSINARAWLAERCRILGKPMVEGGFSGADFNISVFSPAGGAVCYRCGHPEKDSSVSCTLYALEAEALGIVPAIQTSAAVVGGYQAEQTVQILHGLQERFGYRSYGNIRSLAVSTALLPVDPECPSSRYGRHHPLPVIGTLPETSTDDRLADLAARIEDQFGRATILLPEYAVITQYCTRCKRTMCRVQAAEAAWLADPRCVNCGGPWPPSDAASPEGKEALMVTEEMSEALQNTCAFDLGLRGGSSIEALTDDGKAGILRVAGSVLTYAISAQTPVV